MENESLKLELSQALSQSQMLLQRQDKTDELIDKVATVNEVNIVEQKPEQTNQQKKTLKMIEKI